MRNEVAAHFDYLLHHMMLAVKSQIVNACLLSHLEIACTVLLPYLGLDFIVKVALK